MLDAMQTAPAPNAFEQFNRSILREALMDARQQLVVAQDHLPYESQAVTLPLVLHALADVDALAAALGIALTEPPGVCDCCGGPVTLDGDVEVCPRCDAIPEMIRRNPDVDPEH